MPDIGDLDRAILRAWQTDARRSLRDLAAEVGVSATTVHDRARALRRRGVVRGTSLDLDLAQLGRGVQALIAVRIRPPSRSSIEGFRDWVSDLPETVGVFVTSGRSDFIVHVAVADNDALYAFVIDRLTARAEIADVETSVIYEHRRVPPRLDP
ncbi:Lrp/AsnC family transcriptional regulator [Nocardioides zeae]|uniref:Lrp/AsnC family transcriptional regulator n=1 Tax=Nocardioides imazamoxiresistens TaxID=3231893 RepID=A0ABU3PRK8_9ACTN|nr:Lrp/AsnC family transcriptional regulator [Nocardioides zeae]MDT9591859.1 Lrp/AsnC family transcriptional regulator [Nocardioides zeae]